MLNGRCRCAPARGGRRSTRPPSSRAVPIGSEQVLGGLIRQGDHEGEERDADAAVDRASWEYGPAIGAPFPSRPRTEECASSPNAGREPSAPQGGVEIRRI